MIELLGLLEHVLAEDALVETRRSDRAHMMEMSDADGVRERNRVPRPFNVRGLLRLGARRQVVDRREMEEMLDPALELGSIRVRNAEMLLREISDHRNDLAPGRAGFFLERCELLLRALAHEHVDRVAALHEVRGQVPANEAGGAGDEVSHGNPPRSLSGPRSPKAIHRRGPRG